MGLRQLLRHLPSLLRRLPPTAPLANLMDRLRPGLRLLPHHARRPSLRRRLLPRGVRRRHGAIGGRHLRHILRQSIAFNSTTFEGDGSDNFVGSNTESALLNLARNYLAST